MQSAEKLAAALAASEKKLPTSHKHGLDLSHCDLKKDLPPREASPLEVVGTRAVLSGKGALQGKGVLQATPSRALGTLRQDRTERRESLQKQEAIREVDSSEDDTDEEPENSQGVQEPSLASNPEVDKNLPPREAGEDEKEEIVLLNDPRNQGSMVPGLFTGILVGHSRIGPSVPQRRLGSPQAFEESTSSSLPAPHLGRSRPTDLTPSEGCLKAQHLHTQALTALCPSSSGLIPTSCSASTSTSGKPGMWSWKFLLEGPDRDSPNRKTMAGGLANPQDLETTALAHTKNLSSGEEVKSQPLISPGLAHPPHEVLTQSQLQKSEHIQVKKEDPSLSITKVPDASGDRKQNVPHTGCPFTQETEPRLLWRGQEPGSHQKRQDIVLTPDELLKQT